MHPDAQLVGARLLPMLESADLTAPARPYALPLRR